VTASDVLQEILSAVSHGSEATLITWLAVSFLLGILHGIVPDEHTWPITFSYSVGSYSHRGGMKAGFLFSLAFTIQRAVASELAYFFVAPLLRLGQAENVISIVIGAVMVFSGAYVLRVGHHFHLFGFVEHLLPEPARDDDDSVRPLPAYMTLLHGFLAGFAVGAFAMILYTVVVPHMPGPAVAFLPGLFYGLGTMVMQVLLGLLFGLWVERLQYGPKARAYIGRRVAGDALYYGGMAFVLLGVVGFFVPWDRLVIRTGLHLYFLDQIGVDFFLSVVVLFAVAAWAFWSAVREYKAVS